MAQGVQRWIEVTPSQFPHEAEGLNIVRYLLPDITHLPGLVEPGVPRWPGQVARGRPAGPRSAPARLVELKYYSGTLRGDDLTWRHDGHGAEDSPLKLARRKAQRLASKLRDELVHWAQETGHTIPDARTVVPFVQEAVFLHRPGLRCLLPPVSGIDLFGLDGSESETGLPGISQHPPTAGLYGSANGTATDRGK